MLAIRNPLSTTNVLVPVPLQAEHRVRLIPGFNPVPVHGEQSTTGVTSIVFLVPLHASMKEIPTVASRSDPLALLGCARAPPAKPLPNNCSNRFAWEPSEASKNGLNPPPPNPAKPPPKGLRLNASGSNPGCCAACPYWSYPARFLSSLRIYHIVHTIQSGRAEIGNKRLHVLRTLLVSPEIFPLHFCQCSYLDGICEQAVWRFRDIRACKFSNCDA